MSSHSRHPAVKIDSKVSHRNHYQVLGGCDGVLAIEPAIDNLTKPSSWEIRFG
jgi:hypothetical protein